MYCSLAAASLLQLPTACAFTGNTSNLFKRNLSKKIACAGGYLFQGTEFYVNLDRVDNPDLGYFLEVKSRTWSQRDAEHKAELAKELIVSLGASTDKTIDQDYIEIVMSD